jgi:hypothetical protein
MLSSSDHGFAGFLATPLRATHGPPRAAETVPPGFPLRMRSGLIGSSRSPALIRRSWSGDLANSRSAAWCSSLEPVRGGLPARADSGSTSTPAHRLQRDRPSMSPSATAPIRLPRMAPSRITALPDGRTPTPSPPPRPSGVERRHADLAFREPAHHQATSGPPQDAACPPAQASPEQPSGRCADTSPSFPPICLCPSPEHERFLESWLYENHGIVSPRQSSGLATGPSRPPPHPEPTAPCSDPPAARCRRSLKSSTSAAETTAPMEPPSGTIEFTAGVWNSPLARVRGRPRWRFRDLRRRN